MQNQTSIEKLLLTGKKVFTTQDLAVIWGINDRRMLLERIKYYLRTKKLNSLFKGLYGYGSGYGTLEIAQKLVPLSYISLYTTAQIHGLLFQYSSVTYCVALKSKQYVLNGFQEYIYHKVKDTIFFNERGLVKTASYVFADKERTIGDLLYVFPGIGFDNIHGINKDHLEEIAAIYENKRLEREVKNLLKNLPTS